MFQFLSVVIFVHSICASDNSFDSLRSADKTILQECKNFIPQLSREHHKGDRGRIGVFGGSEEYTGAPYLGAMASLRTGSDMVYLFCASPAAIPIKSYSPELMVLPCLDSDRAFEKIKPWLARIHGILVGPGLGRNETVTKNIITMIDFLKEDDDGAVPMVFDADAFYILYAHPNLLRGYPNQVYLTPNLAEFNNLVSILLGVKDKDTINPAQHLRPLAEKFGPKVTILLKGKNDRIAHVDLVTCNKMVGSPRRCGGQGDILAGCLSAMAVWLDTAEFWKPRVSLTHEQLVSYAASAVLKLANEMAYRERGRSMIASDILCKIHPAFSILFDER